MALAAAPAVAGAATVQVTVNDQAPVSIDMTSAPEDDVINRVYTLRGTTGESQITQSGFSVAALLAVVDVSPDAVTSFRVQRLDGTWIVLSGAEAACPVGIGPCPFPDGPAFFRFDGAPADNSAVFLRPVRNTTDQNIKDHPSVSGDMDVEVLTGPLLSVAATATPARATAGKPVALASTVSNPVSGETLSYLWDFKDGHTSAAPSPSHTFARAGTYKATITVTGDLGSSGATSITVRVGNRAGAPSPGGGKHNGPKQEGSPDGSNGGTNPTGNTGADNGANTGGTTQVTSPQPPATGPQPPPPVAGDPVTGVLLAGSTTLDSRQAQVAPAAGEAGSEATGGGLSTALAGVGAGLLLLAAGAGGELRGLRRRVAG